MLENIVNEVETSIGKPIRRGFIFDSNVEYVVAVCRAIAYNSKTLFSKELLEVFTTEFVDNVIKAYGQLPFVDNSTNTVHKGSKTNAEQLQQLLHAVDLPDVLDCSISQSRADTAYTNSLKRLQRIAL
jgi:hypothetical protein